MRRWPRLGQSPIHIYRYEGSEWFRSNVREVDHMEEKKKKSQNLPRTVGMPCGTRVKVVVGGCGGGFT